MTPDGHTCRATMVPGPLGFALAVFPNESPIVTECPNLLIEEQHVLKKPAMFVETPAGDPEVKKKPAANLKKPAAFRLPSQPTKRKNFYSKVYHDTMKAKMKQGADAESCKMAARTIAMQACTEASLAGLLE